MFWKFISTSNALEQLFVVWTIPSCVANTRRYKILKAYSANYLCSKTHNMFMSGRNFVSLNKESINNVLRPERQLWSTLVRELILVISVARNESLTREQITRTANNNSKASASNRTNQPYLYAISGRACGRRKCWLISIINTDGHNCGVW